jgi:hypothetical protein
MSCDNAGYMQGVSIQVVGTLDGVNCPKRVHFMR